MPISLILVLLGGCGADDGTIPVSGSIARQGGEPLEAVSVRFCNIHEGGSYTGATNDDGIYSLRANEDVVGLPAGDYVVVVHELITGDIDNPSPPKIHAKYSRRQSTDLKVTISAGKSTYDFALDPP